MEDRMKTTEDLVESKMQKFEKLIKKATFDNGLNRFGVEIEI